MRSLYSLISTGTEMMKVGESKMSLVGMARARPDQVKKVLETVQQQGPVNAYKKAMQRLDSYTPLGYSVAGVVIEVGGEPRSSRSGSLWRAPGTTMHSTPKSIGCRPISAWRCRTGSRPSWRPLPLSAPLHCKGFGASDRSGTPRGIGLGLVGQLVVQLLVASGVRVVGLDPDQDRCRLAEKAGGILCTAPTDEGVAAVERALAKASGGLGADRIFLVSGGSSNQPVELAARLARDRATVVDIGKCKLDLPWNDYYEKELDLRFSRSYGPGRYDPTYEVDGIDYPAGYVRWTERRNLHCFVNALATKEVDPQPLIAGIYGLVEAPNVYERLSDGSLKGVGFLFEYDPPEEGEPVTARSAPGRTLPASRPDATDITPACCHAERPPRRSPESRLRRRRELCVVHAAPSSRQRPRGGSGACRHVPVVVGRQRERRFGFAESGTDADAVIEDPSLDAVFIVTRHSSHAELACRALEAGKAVFVEKPLALSGDELARVLDTVDATGNDRILVGFNRRYAPLLVEMRARFGNSRSRRTHATW